MMNYEQNFVGNDKVEKTYIIPPRKPKVSAPRKKQTPSAADADEVSSRLMLIYSKFKN